MATSNRRNRLDPNEGEQNTAMHMQQQLFTEESLQNLKTWGLGLYSAISNVGIFLVSFSCACLTQCFMIVLIIPSFRTVL